MVILDISNVELPSNHRFGFFFTIVFGALTAFIYFSQDGVYFYLPLFFALAILLTTILKADFLLPLNKLWMKFGFLIGMVVSPIVLGFVFFGIFMPVSIVMKVFGRDELRLKLVGRASHWKRKDSSISGLESFNNQF